MLFHDITVLMEDFTIGTHKYVAVKDDRIVYIGDEAPKEDFGRIIDGKGKLLMSGFYNAHGHSPMSLLRGYGENLALDRWLNERIFPFEAKLTEDSVYAGTLLTMAESLRYGIVSTTDMYNWVDGMVRAAEESGAKMNLGISIMNFGDGDLWDLDCFKKLKYGVETYQGAFGGRLIMDSSLHAEYTNTDKSARQLAEYTKDNGLRMQIHVSETKSEHEECKGRHGMTPTAWLADMGLLDTPATLAHCVWIEDDDVRIIGEKGATVAANPTSNLKLASGVCDVQRLLDAGVNVAIGTDSVASNNSLNFIESMKLFAIAPKMMYNAPEAVSPVEALKAATVNGARSQGRDDCGLVKEGYKADLILVDISGPWMYPVHDLINNLVYSASGSDVIMTMVDGRVLYEKGEWTTIDVEKAIALAEEETRLILAQL